MEHVTVRRLHRASRSTPLKTLVEKVDNKVALKDAEAGLKKYAENFARIAQLEKANEDIYELMVKQLSDANALGVASFGWVAEIKDVISRESSEIDPKVLFNKCKNREEFFAMVKVQMVAVKDYMSLNEINAIAKKTVAKKTGTKLVIMPAKFKK